MKLTLPTSGEIKKYFPHTRICLVKVLCAFLYCLISKSTVNLEKCKKAFGKSIGAKDINLASAYRRLTRFFNMRHASTFCVCISYLIINLLISLELGGCYWAIDRTNWQIGVKNKINVNMLVLGIVLSNGCFIPILGVPLSKKGNSSQKERIELFKRFITLFAPLLPKCLKGVKHTFLGDREFIGKDWFDVIHKAGFDLVMRLRKDDYLALVAEAMNMNIDKLERKIKRRVKRDGFFSVTIEIKGNPYLYVVVPNSNCNAKKSDKLVRFISNLDSVQAVSKAYRQRWQIEVFFKHIKTNGFNLEDLNLRKEDKILLMTAIVGFAYVLAIKQGVLLLKKKKIKHQYYPNQDKTYPRVSIFKAGYEQLENIIFDLNDLIRIIIQLLPDKLSFDKAILLEEHMKPYHL